MGRGPAEVRIPDSVAFPQTAVQGQIKLARIKGRALEKFRIDVFHYYPTIVVIRLSPKTIDY
jgi:hypothetical protein